METRTIYAKNDYIERENKRIMADIESALSICTKLSIYCAIEDEVWGIWLKVDGVRYLVDPIVLIDSIFMDENYYLFEVYPIKNDGKRTVDIHKDAYSYSWRFSSGILKDARPIYFHYVDYYTTIKDCLEKLYEAWRSGEPVAYNKKYYDFDLNDIHIAVEQMSVEAVMPSYYQLMTSSVKEEVFKFENEGCERYVIGIGNREFKTFLTLWENDYDWIRFQLESFVYKREATVNLTFDTLDTVVKIKHVSTLDQINQSEEGCGYCYKEFAKVEIRPNEFVHGPIICGYCDLKQTIRTFYEGLLRLALDQPLNEDAYYDGPCQLEAYNKYKSPVLERYILGISSSSKKAELRQIHIKLILFMCPNYDYVIRDGEGVSVDVDMENGFFDEIYDKNGNPFKMPELVEWQKEITKVILESAIGNSIPFDWEDYHKRGRALAQQLRNKLSSDFDLWYEAPVEDHSGIIAKPILVYEQK